MTLKSRREIRNDLDDLDNDADREGEPAMVYEHPDTGEWIGLEGRRVDSDACPIMTIVPTDEQIEEVIAGR